MLFKLNGENDCYLCGLVLSVLRSVALSFLSCKRPLCDEIYVIYSHHVLHFAVYLRAINIRVSTWFFCFCNNVPKFCSVISLTIDLHLGRLWEFCCVTGKFIHNYTIRGVFCLSHCRFTVLKCN